ncbi:MAG: hypothetical protein ACK2UE_04970 [Anaerolineales bacterium]
MKQGLFSRLEEFRQRTGFQWGGGEIIVAGILIIGIISMGSGMFSRWIRSSRGGGLLMVDMHSFSSANYGVDEMPVSVPAIGLEILQDLLGMNQPPETGRPAGIALVTPNLPSPTPTSSEDGTLPGAPTPRNTDPGESNPTSRPVETATPGVVRSPTPTVTQPLPAATSTPRVPTSTSQPGVNPPTAPPTSTPQPTKPPATVIPATKTPQPTTVPPTNVPQPSPTPQPSATPQPAVSPTPRPTRSSTLAVTPTTKYTPVDPPPLP